MEIPIISWLYLDSFQILIGKPYLNMLQIYVRKD